MVKTLKTAAALVAVRRRRRRLDDGAAGRPDDRHAEHEERRLDALHRRRPRHASTRRSIRSTPPTSTSWKSRGASRPTTSAPRPEFKLEGTPLAIKGVLYTTAGTRRSVVALDGRTGELIWAHSYREGNRAAIAPRQLSGRGVSYWTDGKGDERILYVTTGYRLIALNAKTGAMIPSFGEGGVVDLKKGAVFGKGQQIDLETGEIGLHSTPTVVKDVVIVGSSFKEGHDGQDAQQHQRPGARVRRARPASCCGRSTRFRGPASSATTRGRTSRGRPTATPACGRRSRSTKKLGLVYLPVEDPDLRLLRRPSSRQQPVRRHLVCVDLKTGQRKWHFQIVHHPIWDYDLSSAPILADITVERQARSRPWRCRARKRSSMCSTASPASRCGRSKSGRCRSPTCPARRRRRRSRSRPNRRPTRGRRSTVDDLIDFTPELRRRGAAGSCRATSWDRCSCPASSARSKGRSRR